MDFLEIGLGVVDWTGLKNGVFWDVTPRGSLRPDVSEELSASIISLTRIGELGTLAVTSNLRTLRKLVFHTNASTKTSDL
jgi:hypothetical protein